MYIYVRVINEMNLFFDDSVKDIIHKSSENCFHMANLEKYGKCLNGKFIFDIEALFNKTDLVFLNRDDLWYTFRIDAKHAFCIFPNGDGEEILNKLRLDGETILSEDEWIIKGIIE